MEVRTCGSTGLTHGAKHLSSFDPLTHLNLNLVEVTVAGSTPVTVADFDEISVIPPQDLLASPDRTRRLSQASRRGQQSQSHCGVADAHEKGPLAYRSRCLPGYIPPVEQLAVD